MSKKTAKSKINKSMLILTYGIIALFAGLMGYFFYFIQFQSETIINNSYNARLDSFSDRVLRGKILSSDGTVLAETMADDEGNETRRYPFGAMFSHVTGYADKGKTGLEGLGNFYLLSSHMNIAEQVINELSGVKNKGDYVITTLDTRLQQAAWEALGDRRGAAIVLEPDTGKILAMVSKPDFNPETVSTEWDVLTSSENESAQLLNRSTQGLYAPGSTYKLVTLLEFIRENPDDYESFEFDCDGIYEKDEYSIKCYHETAHGHLNLMQAFANSCNGAFAEIGLSLDKNKFAEMNNGLLFNSELPYALPYNKSAYSMTETAGNWEVLQTSIGQGATQITPLHNILISAAAANGGVLMKPYFIDRVENAAGDTVKKFHPESYGSLMTADEAALLSQFMRTVVTDGTGSAVNTQAYTAAGKTGSAEFETGKETHAWFVGFAPAEAPQIAVCVIVEEGGSGGSTAAPVARRIFDTFFS